MCLSDQMIHFLQILKNNACFPKVLKQFGIFFILVERTLTFWSVDIEVLTIMHKCQKLLFVWKKNNF